MNGSIRQCPGCACRAGGVCHRRDVLVCVSVLGVTEAAGDDAGRWRAFGERVIYESPEIWLGEVDVGLPDGERIWRHVVRLHRSAAVVLTDGQDRVLVLWRHRFVQDRWGWELPGGLVDEGEEPAGAAARELEEQTGYGAGQLVPLISFQPMAETADSEHVVFVGQDARRIGQAIAEEGIGRAEWVPLASVPGLISAGQVWNSASVVGLLQFLAQRSSAPGG